MKEINIYQKEDSLTLLEMYEDRGMNVDKDSKCIQLKLTDGEVKELIRYLEAQLEWAYVLQRTRIWIVGLPTVGTVVKNRKVNYWRPAVVGFDTQALLFIFIVVASF